MTLSQRLRIVLGGGALVTLTGVAAAWAFFSGTFAKFLSLGLLVAAAIVLAPVFLILAGVASQSTGPVTAALLIAGGVVTLLGFPIYPILRLPRWRLVSFVGLLAWIACQVYVVAAARAL